MVECSALSPFLKLLRVLAFGRNEGVNDLRAHRFYITLSLSLLIKLFEVYEETWPAKTGDFAGVYRSWATTQVLCHLLFVLSAIPNEYTMQSLHALILLHLLG